MKPLNLCFVILFFSLPIMANEFSQANKLSKTPGFDKIKLTYEKCVLTKGVRFAKVSTLSETIKFAPLACKRELLAIRKFFLHSAFKQAVIIELVDSIRAGVEIDLINTVYKERLKYVK
ncbi:MAG: hypothetical protein COB35_02585 [Gammaproteobacteria bacterium]|nr:MAG: hypothetical protein COB35_02585 [Gammaproteobacteria bacterium]